MPKEGKNGRMSSKSGATNIVHAFDFGFLGLPESRPQAKADYCYTFTGIC